MRTLLIVLFLSLSFAVCSQPSIENLRIQFFDMEKDSCSAVDVFESIKSEAYPSALLQAYAGATEAAAAQCVKGAFTKLEYFSRGKKNLESAIEKEPENAEIRFLRFATQVNAPNFLEYDNINEDIDFILEKLPKLLENDAAKSFWLKVAHAMTDSGKLSKKEADKLLSITQ